MSMQQNGTPRQQPTTTSNQITTAMNATINATTSIAPAADEEDAPAASDASNGPAHTNLLPTEESEFERIEGAPSRGAMTAAFHNAVTNGMTSIYDVFGVVCNTVAAMEGVDELPVLASNYQMDGMRPLLKPRESPRDRYSSGAASLNTSYFE